MNKKNIIFGIALFGIIQSISASMNDCSSYQKREQSSLDTLKEQFKKPEAKNRSWIDMVDGSLNNLYRTIISKIMTCSENKKYSESQYKQYQEDQLKPYYEYTKKYENITGKKHVPRSPMSADMGESFSYDAIK